VYYILYYTFTCSDMWADIDVLYNTAAVRRNFDVFCGGMEWDRAIDGCSRKLCIEQPNNLTPLENSYHSVNDLSFRRKGRRCSVIYPPENKYIMMEDQLITWIVRHTNIIRSDSFKCIVLQTIFYLYIFVVKIYFYLRILIFISHKCVAKLLFFFKYIYQNLLPYYYYLYAFVFLIFIYYVFFYHNTIFFIVIFVTIKFVLKLFFQLMEKKTNI